MVQTHGELTPRELTFGTTPAKAGAQLERWQ